MTDLTPPNRTTRSTDTEQRPPGRASSTSRGLAARAAETQLRGRLTVGVTVLIAVLVATTAVSGLAAGQEAVPASYYGDVTVNGEPADAGTEIEAVVDGTVYDTITAEEAGTLGGSDPFEEKLTVEEPDSGDTVEFRVDDVTADTTVTWESGDVREVGLSFDTDDSDNSDDTDDSDDSDDTDDSDDSDDTDDSDDSDDTDDSDDSDDTDDSDDSDDTDAGSGGGGGGGGGLPPVEDDTEPSNAEVIQSAEASIGAADEGESMQATFDAGAPVESITFESTDIQGSVEVTTQESEPSDITPSSGTAVQVSEITVPDDATDTPATIRMRASADRLAEVDATADELRVTRLSNGEWEMLETTVAEETTEGVVLEAETPGFSYFAVSAVSEPEAAAAVDPETVTAGEAVTLEGNGSTVEHGEIVTYDWSVAGESFSGETTDATIAEAGEYTIELTVTTDAGETDTATADLVVEPAADDAGTDSTADGDDQTEEQAGLGIPAIGGLVVVVVVAATAVAVYRQRRSNENNSFR